MLLPTIGLGVTSGLAAARRFPFVLGAGVVASYAGMALVNRGESADYVRLLVSATLGLPLLFALTVLAERRGRAAAAWWAIPAAGVVALAVFWAAWPRWSSPVQMLRYAQLSAAFHLLVAFLPYAGYDEPNGFWHYNRTLFLRFLTASLYSGVLYAGLAVALLALDKLLGVPVPGEGYARLWIAIAFVFNTWFFVGGVPEDLSALETRGDYPTGLRVFTQYVLVPIVALYLLILTLYLGKVLITRQWPSGWIGYLVSSVASVGTLSWLLVYPLEQRAEYAWVKRFTRGFYVVLMPAIVMLWLALWKRVEQYGVTEPRYFLIVLSVWLAGISLYYTMARSRSVKVIPATLCALALMTFAGPWSAYAVSRASQVARLRAVLVRNDLLANGVLRRAARGVPYADRREISGALRYLLDTHGERAIATLLTDSLRHALAVGRSGRTRGSGAVGAEAIMTALSLEYVPPWETTPGVYFSYYTSEVSAPLYIGGYTYAMRISLWRLGDSLRIADGTYLGLAQDSMSLRVVRDGLVLLAIPLRAVVDSGAAYSRRHPNAAVPSAVLRVEMRSGNAAALVRFTGLTGMKRPDGTRLTSFEGDVFLRLP